MHTARWAGQVEETFSQVLVVFVVLEFSGMPVAKSIGFPFFSHRQLPMEQLRVASIRSKDCQIPRVPQAILAVQLGDIV